MAAHCAGDANVAAPDDPRRAECFEAGHSAAGRFDTDTARSPTALAVAPADASANAKASANFNNNATDSPGACYRVGASATRAVETRASTARPNCTEAFNRS